jgi:hypothetical protein
MSDIIPTPEPTKVCSKCKVEKPISRFYKKNKNNNNLRSECKKCTQECRRKTLKDYELKHRDIKKEYNKKYNFNHRNNNVLQCKRWRTEHDKETKEYNKQYYRDHKKESYLHTKKYYLEHNADVRISRNRRTKERLKTDINFKILKICRSRIQRAIKCNFKSSRSVNLLGCTIPELKLYIEKQWKPGMTWENWGRSEGDQWQIDHVIPCAFFDMSDPVEQYMCFNYENLQPLWWKENIEKRDKII